jgi:addiction module RelE/StbE family toxin
MRLAWTAQARDDLEAATAYIDLDRPTSAEALVATVLTAVDRLIDYPNLGHIGRRKGTREVVFGDWPYILAYAIKDDTLYVLRIVHTARRWPRLPSPTEAL